MEYIDIATKEQAISNNNVIIAENVEKVYEAGKIKERSDFWEGYQDDNANYSYSYRFAGAGWKKDTFRPTKNMNVVGGSCMFLNSAINVDLVEHLENLGVTLSFARCASGSQIFQNSKFTRLGDLDFRNMSKINTMFSGCTELETIDMLFLKDDGSQEFPTCFTNCTKLVNLDITGKIGKSFDVKSSPLNESSAIAIINNLKNYRGTSEEGKYAIYFSSTTIEILDNGGALNDWRDILEMLGWSY